MRRLVLAFSLIVGVSAILLLSDFQNRQSEPVRRPAKVFMIEYNRVFDVEESEAGILDGLQAGGLQKGTDYTIEILNAQGDIATVNSLIDAAVAKEANMLITLSTPTLQAAARKFKGPVVFTYVANPIAAGVGRTGVDHFPNLTGVYATAPYEEMVDLIKEVIPGARSIGTIFVPAEANMIYHIKRLEKAVSRAGLQLTTVAADTAAEVSDAASALCMRGIDAVCQVPGNLTASSFPAIASAARQARMPVFAFQTSQARGGAVIVLGRDNYDAGHQTGVVATRVLRGESPARIPFEEFTGVRVMVNLTSARELGLTIPPSLLKRSEQTIP